MTKNQKYGMNETIVSTYGKFGFHFNQKKYYHFDLTVKTLPDIVIRSTTSATIRTANSTRTTSWTGAPETRAL